MSADILFKPAFDFEFLWNVTQILIAQDPGSPSLIYPYPNSSIATLTYHGCTSAVDSGAAPYTRQDVYDRVLLWRVPLIALWATTTLPALGFHTKVFTLIHLIADPIDTVWSLLYSLDLAKRNAKWTKKNDQTDRLFTFPSQAVGSPGPLGHVLTRTQTIVEDQRDLKVRQERLLQEDSQQIKEYFWDVIALIITAYDEWGYGDACIETLLYSFDQAWPSGIRADIRELCASTAFYIASDRVSKFLPSVISTIVFLIQIFAGFFKTLENLGNTFENSNPVSRGLNRTPHNIAFGVLFFWLPFAVLMTAYVGGSHTSQLVPRVLDKFRQDVGKLYKQQESSAITPAVPEDTENSGSDSDDDSTTAMQRQQLPEPAELIETLRIHPECTTFPKVSYDLTKRWGRGGLPVWQPAKFQDRKNRRTFWKYGLGLSFVVVLIPTACAVILSYLTPTEGFGCRTVTQISFLGFWIVNIVTDWALCAGLSGFESFNSVQETALNSRMKRIYYITFARDFIFMGGTIVLLTESAVGMFNKCSCWSKWLPKSYGYISFPQEQYIFLLIKSRLSRTFPYIVIGALMSQIIIFAIIAVYFRYGYRVLKQRDYDKILTKAEAEQPNHISRGGFFERLSKSHTPGRTNTLDAFSTSSQYSPIAQTAHENSERN